jgi:hypothetical protein
MLYTCRTILVSISSFTDTFIVIHFIYTSWSSLEDIMLHMLYQELFYRYITYVTLYPQEVAKMHR